MPISVFPPVAAPVSQKTAFGEDLVAELTPVVQLHFPYNINTRLAVVRDNNGTSSVVNNKLQVSTGAAANQSSQVLSREPVNYNPGQGALCRFTAVFTTGAANSTQYIGIGDSSEGYFFGYNGTAFGLLRRQGGSPEIRTLTVTTGSSTAEDITITLDGDAETTVTVTNTANTTLTANEIAAHDYSNVGQGWTTHVMGATVVFESYNAALQTGTYSLSGATTAVGTFAQSVAGAAPTETVVAQSAWSEDVMDGTGPSGVTLDQTKGNVYQIRYQWLGFGAIEYSVEDPSNGDLVLVHRIEYANANTIPSVDNPALPLCIEAINTSNTTDIVLQTSSMGGFVEGRNEGLGISNGASVEIAGGIGMTETPVLSIHNHTVFQSVVNRVKTKLELLTSSVDSAAVKVATVRVRLGADLTGASFNAVDDNTSVMRTDIAATAVSGGTVLFAQGIEQGDSLSVDLDALNIDLTVGETITISLESSSGTVATVTTVNWLELF